MAPNTKSVIKNVTNNSYELKVGLANDQGANPLVKYQNI